MFILYKTTKFHKKHNKAYNSLFNSVRNILNDSSCFVGITFLVQIKKKHKKTFFVLKVQLVYLLFTFCKTTKFRKINNGAYNSYLIWTKDILNESSFFVNMTFLITSNKNIKNLYFLPLNSTNLFLVYFIYNN